MRVNVYTEELISPQLDNQPLVEIVHADYVSSRTGESMRNYGLRIYLKSHPDLHYLPGRDDDRSAVTFWCGTKEKNVFKFSDMVREFANQSTLNSWRERVRDDQKAAEETLENLDAVVKP